MSGALKKCQPRALTPYVDGELAHELEVELEEHLRGCPSCGALLDTLVIARDRVHGLGRATIPMTALEPAVAAFGERTRGDAGDALADEDAAIEAGRRRVRSGLAVIARPQPRADEAVGEAEPEPEREAERWAESPTQVQAERWAEPPTQAEAAGPGPEVSLPAELEAAAPEPPPPAGIEPEPPSPADLEPEPPVALEGEPAGEPPVEPHAAAEQPAENPTQAPEPDLQPDLQFDLPAHASAIPAQPDLDPAPTPPWLGGETMADAELLAEGMRAVDEQLAAEAGAAVTEDLPLQAGAEEAEPESEAAAAPVPEPSWPEMLDMALTAAATDEAGAAVERMRAALHAEPARRNRREAALDRLRHVVGGLGRRGGGTEETVADTLIEARLSPAVAAEPEVVDEPLGALSTELEEPAARPRRRLLPFRDGALPWAQPVLILAAALVVGLLIAGGGFAKFGRAPATSATRPRVATSVGVPPASQPSPQPTTSTTAPQLQLTDVVSKGTNGSGYTVLRIRSGVPTAGVLRVVLDMDGGNGLPPAQLGTGPDGYYLTLQGVGIDQGVVQAFQANGVVTGVSLLPGSGVTLKLTTAQPQHYTLSYLTGPTRLVIDFSS